MEAQRISEIRPALTTHRHEFEGCFANVRSQRHLETYVAGQLSDLERKSIEPMAAAAGVPPRTLQEFLSLARWDEATARERLQRRVAHRHSHPRSVGIIDETSYVKKGNKTACVQRQHCGAVGKTANCVVSVHLGCAAGDLHTLLDGEPSLPKETWHNNRTRCRAAGIPDGVLYRPKWRMALGQYRRALRLNLPPAVAERILPERIEYTELGVKLEVRDEVLYVFGTHGEREKTILTVRLFERDMPLLFEPQRSFDLRGWFDKLRARATTQIEESLQFRSERPGSQKPSYLWQCVRWCDRSALTPEAETRFSQFLQIIDGRGRSEPNRSQCVRRTHPTDRGAAGSL